MTHLKKTSKTNEIKACEKWNYYVCQKHSTCARYFSRKIIAFLPYFIYFSHSFFKKQIGKNSSKFFYNCEKNIFFIKPKKLKTKNEQPWSGYDSECDATISQEMSTAAMRFGHTLIREQLPRMSAEYANESLPIPLKVRSRIGFGTRKREVRFDLWQVLGGFELNHFFPAVFISSQTVRGSGWGLYIISKSIWDSFHVRNNLSIV